MTQENGTHSSHKRKSRKFNSEMNQMLVTGKDFEVSPITLLKLSHYMKHAFSASKFQQRNQNNSNWGKKRKNKTNLEIGYAKSKQNEPVDSGLDSLSPSC